MRQASVTVWDMLNYNDLADFWPGDLYQFCDGGLVVFTGLTWVNASQR